MKILCVGHSACRTGAPASLYRLLSWMKENTEHEVVVVLGDDRELFMDYCNLFPTTLSPYFLRRSKAAGLWGKVLQHVRSSSAFERFAVSKFKDWISTQKFDLVLSNTVMNAREVTIAKSLGLPVICRVAELNSIITLMLGIDRFQQTSSLYSRFIAVAEPVRDNLSQSYGIPKSKIDVIHGVVDHTVLKNSINKAQRGDFCQRFGVDPSAFIIGGCGRPDWRKGSDLFLQVARMITKKHSGIVFVWAGGIEGSEDLFQMRMDVEMCGLSESCFFIGPLDDVAEFYNSLDIFFLTSREDPFPLVVLEAAAASLPTLCFQKSGGAVDFILDDAGSCIPFMELEAAAATLVKWSSNRELVKRMGHAARTRVEGHYTIESVGPKFLETFAKVISNTH